MDTTYTSLQKRSFQFPVRNVKFCRFLDEEKLVSRRITARLQHLGTSIGAIIAESKSA